MSKPNPEAANQANSMQIRTSGSQFNKAHSPGDRCTRQASAITQGNAPHKNGNRLAITVTRNGIKYHVAKVAGSLKPTAMLA